jgi:hypothetical protein
MAIIIENNGVSLKITENGNSRYIFKYQIKDIEILRDTIIKIDIGLGALNNFYIDQAQVTTPVSTSVEDLRDKIVAMLQTTISGFSTEANQTTQINLLTALQTTVTDLSNKMSANLDNTPLAPSIVDESIIGIVYNGYAVPGAKTIDPVWAIQKVFKVLGVTYYQWAGGAKTYNKIWNNRLTLSYS